VKTRVAPLLFVMLLGACTGAAPNDVERSLVSSPAPSAIVTSDATGRDEAIATGTWTVSSGGTEQSAMMAPLEGTLFVDDNQCLRVRVGSTIVTMIWPSGYHTAGVGRATRLLDAENLTIASVGDKIAATGGYGSPPPGPTSDCLTGIQEVFIANSSITRTT